MKKGSRSTAPLGTGAAALVLAWLLACAPAEGLELTVQGANRAFEGLELQGEPAERGPFTVRLWARDARLRLLSHRLTLHPLEDGSHRAHLAIRGAGSATLWASVSILGWNTQQSGAATAPEQGKELTGRILLTREADRYRVTPLELPRDVTVRVDTVLAERVAGWCDGLPLLSALGADCGALRRAVTTATVPLPPPGATYDIPRGDLSPEEQRALDDYLEAAQRSGPDLDR
ncbi:MAG: hypothetical protein SCH98_13100 [Deferrisomatales bacterium]|nr:hypothetical protein [Deferrisomatales bacterium]